MAVLFLLRCDGYLGRLKPRSEMPQQFRCIRECITANRFGAAFDLRQRISHLIHVTLSVGSAGNREAQQFELGIMPQPCVGVETGEHD
jgi:hypothetical protein